MKKIAIVFIATLMVMINMISVSAEEAVNYELDLPEYVEFANQLETIKYDKEIIEVIKKTPNPFSNDSELPYIQHIYKWKNGNGAELMYEFGSDNVRYFSYGRYGGIRYCGDTTPPSKEQIYEILEKNNLDSVDLDVSEKGNIKINNDISFETYLDVFHALVSEFDGFYIEFIHLTRIGHRFSDVTGDSDKDGNLDVRDAADIAYNIANGNSNDFHSNIDYNKDEKVNIRDAAAIAKYLAEN